MTIADNAMRVRDHRARVQSVGSGPLVRSHLRPVRTLPVATSESVGVVSRSAFQGEATTAWIRSLGYEAERIDADGLASRTVLPRVLFVHGADAVAGVDAAVLVQMRVVVLVETADSATALRAARVIPNDSHAGGEIQKVIGRLLGTPSVGRPVPLSPREQEVLATYVLGDTVKETAAIHFIAECTVRTHYRRVTRRYEDAGRPVANKSQLLLAMVADGWLRLDGSLGNTADE